MNAYASPNGNFDNFGQRMESLWEHIEDEFHYAVGYVDRVVVPQARHEAGGAARTLARHLNRLADWLDPAYAASQAAPQRPPAPQEGNGGL
jgi:hypothetical protein